MSEAPRKTPWHETALAGTYGPVALAAALLVAHSLLFNFVTDDAFISFVYSRNFARSGELVFNPGEYVEGYTNFLWTLLLGILYKLRLAPEVMSRVLATAASIGTLYLMVRIAERVRGGRRTPAHVLAPLLCAGWGGFACWTSGGLESAPFTFLCVLGVWRYLEEAALEEGSEPDKPTAVKRHWAWRWSTFAFAAAALTRPEGLLVFGIVGVHRLVWLGVRWRLPRRDDWAWAGAFVVIVGGYIAWRWSYYGWPLPNTFYIKSSGGSNWGRGFYYLRQFTRQSRVLYAAPIVLASLAIVATRPQQRARARFLTLAIPLLAAYLLYVARVGGDFMGLHRFIMPTFPLIALLLQDGALCFFALVPAPPARSRIKLALYLVHAAVILAQWGRLMSRESHHAIRWVGADNGIDSPGFLRKYTRDRATIGKWFFVHARRDDYMSVGGAGAQPWYADLRALDAFGLSDEFIAHKVRPHTNRPGHQKWAPDDYVFRRRPSILCHVYQLTNHPSIDGGRLQYFAREGYYFITVRIPGLGEHYTFAVLLTERGAPLLHGKELEDRLAERLKLEGDDFVRAWDPPA